MCCPERLGELNSGITADRMPHNGNRLRVAAVIADRLIGHTTPARVGVVVGRDAAAINALRQFIHAPIDLWDQTVEQISAAANGLLGLSSRVETCGYDDRRHDG